MNMQRVMKGLAAVAVVLTVLSFLPISPSAVRGNTVNRIVRDGISELVPEASSGPTRVRLRVSGETAEQESIAVLVGRQAHLMVVEDQAAPELHFTVTRTGSKITVAGELAPATFSGSARMGDWLALAPPVIAVILAVFLRNILVALALAVWSGAWIMTQSNPLVGLWSWVADYLWPVLTDTFNLQILGFTFGLVGMIAVIGRMGGTLGLVNALSHLARGPRSTQVVTCLMGFAVFFDDYANTVVVGTTARGLTDRMRISREKLAYIVDSTSAPIAGVALVSTWIGYEVGLFDSLLGEFQHIPGLPDSGYALFFEIIPLRFYCFFSLILVLLVGALGRDFGPMLTAERRVRAGGPVVPPQEGEVDSPDALRAIEKEGVSPRWFNAVIPVVGVLVFIFARIWQAGGSAIEGPVNPFSMDHWRLVFTKASDDISAILVWSSLFGSALAFGLGLGQGLLGVKEMVSTYFAGVRTLLEAACILILAWMIKSVCDDLGTGMALVALVADSLSAVMLPLAIFVLAGMVAFCTGTSWGTMALILPVAAPLSVMISGEPFIIIACMGAVLDGAIWGDHCSPISDTTVLSSTATGCPHMDHVRTQLPYAVLAMMAAGLTGYLGIALGLPIAFAYLLGTALMAAGLLLGGRSPESESVIREDRVFLSSGTDADVRGSSAGSS